MWITPFSGPSQRSWLSRVSRAENAPRSPNTSATGRPITSGASERTAATVISLPRPTVNARPKPSCPPLVRTVT
jgi:hypothetical protein